ncbi:PRD domain-containing protein [Ignavigranum ruoffiae]|uniref:PRD domain-containing protein n=1 Tax=Ignavigranum ruoffiae TaxID=89093 RepID=UPI0024ACA82D|nr:PRD domain-containing protein [Ignavigranum ruoffiae]
MKIIQSLNQNAVLVRNQANEEIILTGRGIGFAKKVGDTVDEDKISKVYQCEYTSEQKIIVDAIKEIPEDILLITEDLLTHVEDMLGEQFIPFTSITFASHLYHALARSKDAKHSNLSLQTEFKHIFPREYQAAIFSIRYLKEKYDLFLDDLEVSFLILHFLNGSKKATNLSSMLEIGKIIGEIIVIIEDNLPGPLDKENLFYDRFILHLRYFLIRKMNGQQSNDSQMGELYQFVSHKFSKAQAIVEKVCQVLAKDYQLAVEDSEKLYLTLHIQRLIDELNMIGKELDND